MHHQTEPIGMAGRVRKFIDAASAQAACNPTREAEFLDAEFNRLALELFRLQSRSNPVCQQLCRSLGLRAESIRHWTAIPTLTIRAFKEFAVTSLPADGRHRVFHSSGTTGQNPSRHFHNAASLALYEASLLPWFRAHLVGPCDSQLTCLSLTPPPAAAPHSSLVHMLDTIRQQLLSDRFRFLGRADDRGIWELEVRSAIAELAGASARQEPLLIVGTAFLFVHLMDGLVESGRSYRMPAGSRVLETGGYKGRSRAISKSELYGLIERKLGIPRESIVSEYGMSELGSQAYDHVAGDPEPASPRTFRFPPWARARVISPEHGQEVQEGQEGLLQVVDLANVWSAASILTEDLGIRRGDGFELIGRAVHAEPRGCSILAA